MEKVCNPFMLPSAGSFSDAATARQLAHTPKELLPNDGATHRLLRSGPAIAGHEVEQADVTAIEVVVLWGDDVLHVGHLTPPRSFHVGDMEGRAGVDFYIPAETLGVRRMPLVLSAAGAITAIVPAQAKGTIHLPAQGTMDIEQARTAGLLRPCAELRGAEQVDLPIHGRTRLEVNGFVFQVGVVTAGKRLERSLNPSSRVGLLFGVVSAAVHLGVVAALMWSPGNSLDDESAGLDKSTAAYIMQLQKNAAGPETPDQEVTSTEDNTRDSAGVAGTSHAGPMGQMGSLSGPKNGGYYQIKGPPDAPEVSLERTRALIERGDLGALGALKTVFGARFNTPVAFDSDARETIGRDPSNFDGTLIGDYPGHGFGFQGLGPLGTGPGGGGLGPGIGIGSVGDFGRDYGTGPGTEIGGGPGRHGIGHKTRTVKMLEQGTDMVGRLPPEAIRRIIRSYFSHFRGCYEQGLKRDPGLRGTVGVRFIIDATGAVESANLAGSSMPDGAVSSCVLGVYRGLSFPAPESGKVMVTYPIDFQNDE